MREILFKAKGQTDNRWHYGLLERLTPSVCHIKDNLCHGWICNPDTLCQYTGFKDKNGNKIWENDICHCISVSNTYDVDCISAVYWDKDGCWGISESEYCDNLLSYYDMTRNYISHVPEIEVIGNIFDNPELLKEGAE